MPIYQVNYVDFINNVNNHDQVKILMNIFTNESVCYLTNIKKYNNSIDIHMLGQQNGNKPRSSYIVTIDTLTRKLKCNCKDFIFRCKSKNIVCKHISFIVFRYSKIYSNNYIDSKVLSDIELATIISFLNDNQLLNKYTLDDAFNNIDKLKDNDQECPICCEILSYKSNKTNYIVSCPKCKNVVHEECIRKWLNYNKTCVYCRSNSWKNF